MGKQAARKPGTLAPGVSQVQHDKLLKLDRYFYTESQVFKAATTMHSVRAQGGFVQCNGSDKDPAPPGGAGSAAAPPPAKGAKRSPAGQLIHEGDRCTGGGGRCTRRGASATAIKLSIHENGYFAGLTSYEEVKKSLEVGNENESVGCLHAAPSKDVGCKGPFGMAVVEGMCSVGGDDDDDDDDDDVVAVERRGAFCVKTALRNSSGADLLRLCDATAEVVLVADGTPKDDNYFLAVPSSSWHRGAMMSMVCDIAAWKESDGNPQYDISPSKLGWECEMKEISAEEVQLCKQIFILVTAETKAGSILTSSMVKNFTDKRFPAGPVGHSMWQFRSGSGSTSYSFLSPLMSPRPYTYASITVSLTCTLLLCRRRRS